MSTTLTNDTIDSNGQQSNFSRSEADARKSYAEAQNARPAQPIPLKKETPPPEPYPFEALGPILGPAARCVHETVMAPDAICGQSFLAAAALMAQPHVDIFIDGRSFPSSLYFMTICETGSRKSAADNYAMRPIETYQKATYSDYRQKLATYKNDYAAWRKQWEKAVKDEDSKKLKTLVEPTAPIYPMIICEEPTYQGLIHGLHLGQPSQGIFSDEAGRMIGGHAMNSDNWLMTISGLSSLWDGKPITRVRRGDGKADESYILYGRRISAHLMMQPIVLRSIQKNRAFYEQGFMARFLVASPDSLAGSRAYQELDVTDFPEFINYLNRSSQILNMKFPVKKDDEPNQLSPPKISLSPEAKRCWMSFYNEIERSLGADGKHRPVQGMACKAADMASRIASVIEFFPNYETQAISLENLERATILEKWYLREALRIEETEAVDQETENASKKLMWMQRKVSEGGSPVFTLRQLCRDGANPRSAKDVRRLMSVLMDHRYLISKSRDEWTLEG